MTNDTQAAPTCCSTTAPKPAVTANGRDNLLGGGADDMTTCPVMVGSPVSKKAAEAAGLFRDFEGQRYYFCCAGCGPAFDSDPAKFAANMA
ncbi:YHS domain-containing protein [Microbacterium esteraromaticum]|uniref:YHS domain-containing protein n=1 Tax=Microbacterium esteraromaticum TaxID=57043 RepID=UPI00195983A7|nr:YHS domain-containing protein [Microbacterium esteraromaticum]MBM7465276.1 YHS domain-containing protein [Microbacterium esteraromaticum]